MSNKTEQRRYTGTEIQRSRRQTDRQTRVWVLFWLFNVCDYITYI